MIRGTAAGAVSWSGGLAGRRRGRGCGPDRGARHGHGDGGRDGRGGHGRAQRRGVGAGAGIGEADPTFRGGERPVEIALAIISFQKADKQRLTQGSLGSPGLVGKAEPDSFWVASACWSGCSEFNAIAASFW